MKNKADLTTTVQCQECDGTGSVNIAIDMDDFDAVDCDYCNGHGSLDVYPTLTPPALPTFSPALVGRMSDAELFSLSKELLAAHYNVQAEMSRRRKAAQPVVLAACGHPSVDGSERFCTCEDCDRYVPF